MAHRNNSQRDAVRTFVARHAITPNGCPGCRGRTLARHSRRATAVHRRTTGYSLLEVILATAILAGSSMVLASLISAGANLGSRSQDRTESMLVAQTLVDETLAIRHGEIFEEEGLFSESSRWSYVLRTESDDATGMIRVIAEVFPIESSTPNSSTRGEADPAARLVRWYLPHAESGNEFPSPIGGSL